MPRTPEPGHDSIHRRLPRARSNILMFSRIDILWPMSISLQIILHVYKMNLVCRTECVLLVGRFGCTSHRPHDRIHYSLYKPHFNRAFFFASTHSHMNIFIYAFCVCRRPFGAYWFQFSPFARPPYSSIRPSGLRSPVSNFNSPNGRQFSGAASAIILK